MEEFENDEELKLKPIFDGLVTIRVRFRSRADYEKFRKYILKTEWSYDLDYPMWEELRLSFHNTEDVEIINKRIIGLLQNGFEVYCCKYQLEEHLAAEEHPAEEDPEPMDLEQMVSDIWKKCKKGIKVEL